MTNSLVIVIVFLITAFTAVGDYNLKKASLTPTFNLSAFIIGLVIYSLLAFIWTFTYKYIKFSLAGSIYGAATALTFAFIGVFILKEPIGPVEITGTF